MINHPILAACSKLYRDLSIYLVVTGNWKTTSKYYPNNNNNNNNSYTHLVVGNTLTFESLDPNPTADTALDLDNCNIRVFKDIEWHDPARRGLAQGEKEGVHEVKGYTSVVYNAEGLPVPVCWSRWVQDAVWWESALLGEVDEAPKVPIQPKTQD